MISRSFPKRGCRKCPYTSLDHRCRYCRSGEGRMVSATLTNGKFLFIYNWCGCMTDEESYHVSIFDNLQEVETEIEKYVEQSRESTEKYGGK